MFKMEKSRNMQHQHKIKVYYKNKGDYPEETAEKVKVVPFGSAELWGRSFYFSLKFCQCYFTFVLAGCMDYFGKIKI